MRPTRYSVPEDAMFPFLGINNENPSTLCDPRFSPRMTNVELRQGILGKRRGYESFGAEVDGIVLGVIEFESLTGVKSTVLVTTEKQYVWDGSAWSDITCVDTGATWTGDEDDTLSWCIGADENGKYLFITNGTDLPLYWDGSTATFEVFDGIASLTKAKSFAVFFGRLVLANVTTTIADPLSIVWSVPGDFFDFAGEGSGTGLIADMKGELQWLEVVGDRLYIFSNDSIGCVTYVGGDVLFSFETIIHDTRLVGSRTIVNIGAFVMFMSQETFYLFDGTRVLRSIGDRISRGLRDELDRSNATKCFGFHDFVRHQVLWNVALSDSTSCVYVLEYDTYDLGNLRWVRHEFVDRPTCFGLYTREDTLLWNSASIDQLTWDEAGFVWNQGSLAKDFPIRTIGIDSYVFICDDTKLLDDDAEFDSTWESIDFVVLQELQSTTARWLEVEVELRGTEIDLETSVDKGMSWVSQGATSLTSEWEVVRIPIDVVGRTLRVRVRCDGSEVFEMRSLRVWFRLGGVR
jgi:hypothetical protein